MEQFIIDMLILNAFSYKRFQDEHYSKQFDEWLEVLKKHKGFKTIDQAADYFISIGEAEKTLIA